jgi:pSer/pThr/pTyr-binding forkhead associated (FHA) protein
MLISIKFCINFLNKDSVIKGEVSVVGGKTFLIELGEKQSISIGRDKANDFSFENDDFMSGFHAKLTKIGNDLILEDSKSSNGYELN